MSIETMIAIQCRNHVLKSCKQIMFYWNNGIVKSLEKFRWILTNGLEGVPDKGCMTPDDNNEYAILIWKTSKINLIEK